MHPKPTLTLVLTLVAAPLAQAQQPAPAPSPAAQEPAAAFAAPPPRPAPTTEPLPLDKLVRDAVQNSLGLLSTRAATRGVEAGIDAARAVFDPQLLINPFYSTGDRELLLEAGTASGTQTGRGLNTGILGTLPTSTGYSVSLDYDRQNQDEVTIAQGLPQPQASTTLTARLTQPLLRGAGPTYAQAPVRLARLAARSAQERLDRTVELTIADVETFYWSLGLSEAIEMIARDSLARAQQLLDRNQRMFELELITEVDLISARRGLQQRLTTLTESARRRQDAAERLWYFVYGELAEADVTGLARYHTLPPPGQAPPLPDEPAAVTEAFGQRRDLEAARLDLESADLTRRVAKNALLPEFAVNASYSTAVLGAEDFQLFSTSRPGDLETSDWRFGVAFGFPLGNNAAQGAHARAIADARSQQLAVVSTENAVRSEVRAATRAVRTELERLEQSKLALEYALAQYQASQQQLQLGLIDSFRLLQVEEDVSSAQLVHEQVRYDLALAITNYRLAAGTLRAQYGVGDEPRPKQ